MTSEHLKYLREVLEHDAIGFGEDFQFQDAVEHLEAFEHANEQYRKAMSEQAKRIEQLEAALRFYAEPWKHVDQIPDFYSELDFAETARAALEGKNE